MPIKYKDLIECLIRAKVDLEYGMGFTKNEFLKSAATEINDALDLIYADDESEGIEIWESKYPIPTGWQECDGTNGTPNLVNAYIENKYQTKAIMKRSKR